MIRVILLAALLAAPTIAQTDAEIIDKLADQYGDFAPAVEEKPLDELLPDTDAETAGTDAHAPQSGEATADTAQPDVAQDTPAAVGPAEIPANWTRHEVFGLTFAVPDDWGVMRETDDTYALAAPGFAPREKKGLGLGIQLLDPDDFVEDFLEDPTFAGLLEADKRPPLPVAAGIGFDRFTGLLDQTGAGYAMDGVISRYRHAENGHLTVNFIAFDPALLSEKADLLDRIYATMRLADRNGFLAQTTLIGPDGVTSPEAAQGKAVTTLRGLFSIRVPEGWDLKPGDEEAILRTKTTFSAAITLRRSAAARTALTFDGLFQEEPDESAGRILGQPAQVFSGPATYVGMQSGARIVRGEIRVYLLEHCLPDGAPVVVETAAAPGWLEENDLQQVLAGIEADWPEDMRTCHPAVTARAEWALDGLFAYVLPEGFETGRSRSSYWIRTETGPYATISVGTGPDSFPSDFQLATSNSQGNGFLAPPRTRRADIMGEPATLFVGRSRAGEGSRVQQVALLDQCLPDGAPVVIEMRADDDWLTANGGFDGLLAQKWLVLPGGARACDPTLRETALEVSGAMQESETASQPAAPAAGEQADAFATTPPGWVRHEKFGVSAAVPPDWTVKKNSEDEIIVASPEESTGNQLVLAVRLISGKDVAGRIMSQAATRKMLLASDIEPLPVAPGINFLRFMIDQEAIDSELSMVWAMSQHDLEGRGHPLVALGADTDAALRARMDMVDRILATLRLTDPADFEARTTLRDGGWTPEPIPGRADLADTASNLEQGATPAGWTRHTEDGLSVAVPNSWAPEQTADHVVLSSPQGQVEVLIAAMPADWGKRFLTDDKLRAAVTKSDVRPVELAPGEIFLSFALEPNLSDQPSYMYWLLSRRKFPDRGHPVLVARAKDAETFQAYLPLMQDILATTRLVDPAGFAARGTPVGPDWPLPAPGDGDTDSGAGTTRPVLDGDMSGWTATAAEFEASSAEVTAYPGGDNATSYYIAPATALGDWLGARALRLDKKSSGGRYYSEGYGSEGDIVLEGPGGRATYQLLEDHSGAWRSFVVPLDGTGWVLSQGAEKLDDVLGAVTAMRIRAEYGVGTDRSGLRNVRLVFNDHAAAPVSKDGEWRAVGDPVTGGLDSKAAVENGPLKPTTFRLAGRAQLDRITTYHWNGGRGATPGTIALRDADGRLHGPWPARGSEGQGGVTDANWHAEPGVVLPAGRYTIVDSDPGTWATNDEVGQRGIFNIEIRKVVKRGTGQSNNSPAPSALPSDYHLPARGTAERAALMDAARVPVERELGQKVLFVVSTLRSDGNWAYLAATPVQPNGEPLDWLRTPMADVWRADAMSDLILVVLRRGDDGWQVAEHAIGPTDVAWLDWVDNHGWPRALFAD